MERYSIVLIFVIMPMLSFAQDTIHLNDTKYAYKSGGGFSYICDENQHNIGIDKNVKYGKYILVYENKVIGKINYISKEECLKYYYDFDSTVTAIEYDPYFKLRLTKIDSIYRVSSIRFYENVDEMDFNLKENYYYINIYDRKKKKRIEILNMDFINRE
jgi:hypothetical protein